MVSVMLATEGFEYSSFFVILSLAVIPFWLLMARETRQTRKAAPGVRRTRPVLQA